MATLLLDHLRSIFTPTAANDLARATGEDTTQTQKAIDGLLPAIVSGVSNRAATNDGAVTLYKLLNNTSFATDPSMHQLAQTADHRQKAAESGNRLLQQLYPERADRLAEATATYSGIGKGSASTLAGVIMSVLMGFLHKQLTTRNLTEPQLAALLRDDVPNTRKAIPAALAGLLGWFIGSDASQPVTPLRTEPVIRPITENRDESGTPWWKWLLYLLPLLLLFLLLRNCRNDDDDKATTDTTTSQQTTAPVIATDTVASDTNGNEMATDSANGPEVRVGVDLPGGRKLNVAENSFNYSLATFLSTKGGQLPKVFTFDNLTFETNSARITAKARPNVDDLIQIMQSYPTLQIRIEGHTDSTGGDDLNDELSGERAEAVKQALIAGGIEASRVATRERGDTKPVATNKTEAGREKNRRIDVIVTKV